MVKRFIKDTAKGLVKKKLQEVDFAKYILENLNEEFDKLIAKKVQQALIDLLNQLDEETLTKLALRAKNKALETVERSDGDIEKLIRKITSRITAKLEEDPQLREKLNQTIRGVILKALDNL